jgi:DNA primase
MSAFVDFALVKQQVSMEMVLDHYRIQLRKVNAQSLRGPCPLPAHRSKGESFCVNATKNVWACQSASCVAAREGRRGGNVLDFTSAMEQCTIRDAALKLSNWFMVPPHTEGEARASPARDPETEKLGAERKREGDASAESSAHNKPLGFTLKSIDHAHPYLTERGINKETAEHFGVGFYSGRGTMSGKIVIPIENREGKLVAYAGRAIDESEPKYKMPAGFVKMLELFNLHRAIPTGCDYVICVEGFFGCMRISQSGFLSVVALMGSTLSDVQEEIIASTFAKAVLLLDGDNAGREATADIALRLARRTFVKVIELPEGVQPDQLSTEEIRTLLGSL